MLRKINVAHLLCYSLIALFSIDPLVGDSKPGFFLTTPTIDITIL